MNEEEREKERKEGRKGRKSGQVILISLHHTVNILIFHFECSTFVSIPCPTNSCHEPGVSCLLAEVLSLSWCVLHSTSFIPFLNPNYCNHFVYWCSHSQVSLEMYSPGVFITKEQCGISYSYRQLFPILFLLNHLISAHKRVRSGKIFLSQKGKHMGHFSTHQL